MSPYIIGERRRYTEAECLQHAQRLPTTVVDGVTYYTVPGRIGELGAAVSWDAQILNTLKLDRRRWTRSTNSTGVRRITWLVNFKDGLSTMSITKTRALGLVFVPNPYPQECNCAITTLLDADHDLRAPDVLWSSCHRYSRDDHVFVMERQGNVRFYNSLRLLIHAQAGHPVNMRSEAILIQKALHRHQRAERYDGHIYAVRREALHSDILSH